jgi:hypothetical protein
MELLSARNQRHKRAVRIQVTVSDLSGSGSNISTKTRKTWGQLGGHETTNNPVARALLQNYCCGFNLKDQERMKGAF